jgi:hypothetical protein
MHSLAGSPKDEEIRRSGDQKINNAQVRAAVVV